MSRRLRRACEERLRSQDLPPDAADMAAVVAHLSRRRGRPIHLRAFPMDPGSLTGAWLPTGQADYIFFEQDTTLHHQAQIIAHELGHMICGHPAASHGSLPMLSLVAPGAAEIMLAREAYSDEQEREAEQMADLLVAFTDEAAAPAQADPIHAALLKPRTR